MEKEKDPEALVVLSALYKNTTVSVRLSSGFEEFNLGDLLLRSMQKIESLSLRNKNLEDVLLKAVEITEAIKKKLIENKSEA